MHCCYLQHCCQVSVWNTAFDLVGRADTEWYIWINPVLLTLSQARSLRQELTQGKILSQTSWSCSISMNLQLRFSNQGEEASIVSVVSSFIYLFMHFSTGNEAFISVVRKVPSKTCPYFWCWMQSVGREWFSSVCVREVLFLKGTVYRIAHASSLKAHQLSSFFIVLKWEHSVFCIVWNSLGNNASQCEQISFSALANSSRRNVVID